MVLAGLQGHHDLFQRGIARPLTQAVDSALDLPGSRRNGADGVGHRHAQIVMAVDGEDGLIGIRHLLSHIGDQLGHLAGHGIADGIGQVDGGSAV